MKKVKELFCNEVKRNILFLVISGIALTGSFFGVKMSFDPAWIAILLCGTLILKEAAIGLFTRFDIKADVLVSIALIASVVIGEIFAAGEIAFIMQLGSLLEELTVTKARQGIEKLIHLTPRTARVVNAEGEKIVPADEVKVGDILRVFAGETIAVDGIIIEGQTSIDQSVMTGESIPVDKESGDEVSSGTVNQFGTFDMKAAKVGEDSSLQRMIRLVQSADAGKAKIVGIADKWATWIVVIAITTALATWLVTGQIIRAVTILVVFCPCALVLATPTAIMAAIGNASKYGILIKEGDALERLARVKKITFDKTGTLTEGKLHVDMVKSTVDEISEEELYGYLASAELRSEHPLGKAVVESYRRIKGRPEEPETFMILPGKGVDVLVSGKKVIAGNEKFLLENDILDKKCAASFIHEVESYYQRGCTIIYISVEGRLAGYAVLSDKVRENVFQMVKELKEISVEPALLTGDHPQAAGFIAKIAGIDEYIAECLPEDKMRYIAESQQNACDVCMVGDGINDAPALKSAFVGIAMGAVGSDIAVEAADIALISDDISELPHLVHLSRKMMKTIKINLTFSMALNFMAIMLAITGVLSPVVGALVHNCGSVLVIANSALLLNWKKQKDY